MATPMIPVVSSQISYIGYDDENQKLYVTFTKGGKTYEYSDVPYKIFKEFEKSESIGQYFIKNIKTKYINREV